LVGDFTYEKHTTTLLVLLLSTASFAQTYNNIETEYDKFKDTTSVTLESRIFTDLSFYLSSSFDGKNRTSMPKTVSAFFISLNKYDEYFTSYSCIFLADDKRIRLDAKKYIENEISSFSLNTEDLKKIANSKKVEV
jgi:hypothetical protein